MSLRQMAKGRLKHLLYDACYHFRVRMLPPSQAKKKLAILYLYAERDRYPGSLAGVLKLAKHFRGLDLTCVSIDNLHGDKEAKLIRDRCFDIGGDNRFWEFSGWHKGVQFLRKQRIDPDWVLFVNDAFLNGASEGYDLSFYTSRLNSLLVSRLSPLGELAVGVTYRWPEYHEFLGHDVSSWIRSNLFLLSYAVVVKLKLAFLSEAQIDAILPAASRGELFLGGAQLNPEFKAFLEKWMTERWYGAAKPCPENWARMRAKIVSILNERMLTVQLQRLGVRIVNLAKVYPSQVCCGSVKDIVLT